MILAYLLLLTGLTISSVAIYYSVVGLTAIFSAAAVPIMIMGVGLEVAKLVCATWIKQYWTQVPRLMKTYMVTAVILLMLITSMGIFGFLSKAHNDQNLVSGDVGARLAIYDEKIKTARDNIEADRKQLRQMDEAVDQVMSRSQDEKGADKANAIRNSQKRDRASLAKDIEANQKIITAVNEEAAPVRAENRKVEADVGPLKYIAAFIYGAAPDATMLEKAVTWVIIMIVVVFDPLAVIMLLASQMTFGWHRKPEEVEEQPKTESTFVNINEELEPIFEREEILDLIDYLEGIETVDTTEESTAVEKKTHQIEINYTQQPLVEEPVVESNPLAMDERPGDYVETPQPPARPANPEAAPGRNRGVMHTHLAIEADNLPKLGKAAHSDFGNIFPTAPEKGDVYLRTDFLPNRLFKFNGNQWIQVDKASTDVYAYEEAYIRYLIEEIDSGRYDPDSLSDVERDQIQQYLNRK
jgi:hypothetical protein